LLAFLPVDPATALGIAVESRLFGQRGADRTSVVMDAADVGRASAPASRHRDIPLSIGFRVVNIPDGLLAYPGTIEMTFDDGHGARWSSGWISTGQIGQQDPGANAMLIWTQGVLLDRRFANRVGSSSLTVHGSAWIMLNERRGFDLPNNRRTSLPNGAWCVTQTNSAPPRNPTWWASCTSPFHSAFTMQQTITPAGHESPIVRLLSFWDSPLPSTFGFRPIDMNSPTGAAGAGSAPTLIYFYYQPRAFIHRYFTATNVHLP